MKFYNWNVISSSEVYVKNVGWGHVTRLFGGGYRTTHPKHQVWEVIRESGDNKGCIAGG